MSWHDRLASLPKCQGEELTKLPKALLSVLAVSPPALLLLETIAVQRIHLLALAADELLPGALVDGLDDDDVAACAGLLDDTLRAYLRALHRGGIMDGGIVPEGYTRAAQCAGCGPVWLWPEAPAHVIACPWCFRRKAGRPFPQPERQP